MKTPQETLLVPGGYARAFRLDEGAHCTVEDIEGGQIADFVAFNAEDYGERFSTSHTILALHSIRLRVGDALRSNLRHPMLTVAEDSVGTHDMLVPACDEQRYLVDYGVAEHRSCVANFEEVLAPYGIRRNDIPNPLNIFENASIDEAGGLHHHPVVSRAGDTITFQALMPLICAVSACPMDLNLTGGDAITDIRITIW
ncbi:MAG: urea carboxylase-associated family protein [Synergistales bacterium]|nr:urea carboxylase-associated family protein [Synergistales bacterium]